MSSPSGPTASAAAHASQGLAALQQGNLQAARTAFEAAVTADPAVADNWLGLAFTCARQGDGETALASVNRCLEIAPHNLRALLFKGDHLTQSGATRKALAAYQGALRIAQRSQSLPDDVRAGLARAEEHSQRFTADYQRYLLQQLEADGYSPGQTRFDEALAIAFGDAAPALQQPTRFFYPGLAPIPFFESDQFPELEPALAATESMQFELQAVLNRPESFAPYIVSNPDSVPLNDTQLLNHDDWGAYYFFEQGTPVLAHASACPKTFAVLQELPLPHIPESTPHALFSRLAPHTHIPAHVGLINTRLICHIPLIVPANCGGLRCGNAHRDWEPGTALIFDDTIEHEAWNNTDQERVVLIFDLWRPELSAEERALITRTLAAVAQYEKD